METPETNVNRSRRRDDLKLDWTGLGLLVMAAVFFVAAIVGAVTVR